MMKLVNSIIATFLFGIIFLLSSCDNTIDPFDESSGIFSIYGTLNMYEEVNYIRVKDINTPLAEDSTDLVDAEATLINLDNGNHETLRDTVVQFDDTYAMNFIVTQQILPDTKYELTVTRYDGATSSATTTTPSETSIFVGPEEPDCNTWITVSLAPMSNTYEIRPYIGFEYDSQEYWYTPFLTETNISNGRLNFSFTPKQALDEIFQPERTGINVWCHELDDDEFYVRFQRFSEDWHEESSDSLAIEDGTGRLGGFYERRYHYPLDMTDVSP